MSHLKSNLLFDINTNSSGRKTRYSIAKEKEEKEKREKEKEKNKEKEKRTTRGRAKEEKEKEKEKEKPVEKDIFVFEERKRPKRKDPVLLSLDSAEDTFDQDAPRLLRSRSRLSSELSRSRSRLSSELSSEESPAKRRKTEELVISSPPKSSSQVTHSSYHLRSGRKLSGEAPSHITTSSSEKSFDIFDPGNSSVKSKGKLSRQRSKSLSANKKFEMEKEEKSEQQPMEEDFEMENEEHDDEEHPEEMNLDPAAQTLQTLLRRLGVNLEGQPGVLSSTKLGAILEGLKAIGEDDRQFMALQELCEYLSMGTEETLGGFSPSEFIPPLLQLMNAEYNPEMMLLACRCICNMTEALPASVLAIVNSGAIPVICAKLMSIEYIDLAEQAITTLEKISQESPAPILRAGGLNAVISYLDFFPMGVQRSAITTASNLCRNVPQDCFHYVADAVPILANLLRYQDQKIVEKACLCYSRLVESFARNANNLKIIASQGMLQNMIYLISPNNNISIGPGTFTMIVKLLSIMCKNSPAIALDLLENTDIVIILRDVLSGSTTNNTEQKSETFGLGSPTHMSRPSEQLSELLALCAELLPAVPKNAMLSPIASPAITPVTSSANLQPAPASSSNTSRKRESKRKHQKEEEQSPTKAQEEKPKPKETPKDFVKEQPADLRITPLSENPKIMANFANLLLPTLLDVYSTTVSPSVRQNCLNTVIKIIYFSQSSALENALRDLTVSNFVAGLLPARDLNIVSGGLQLCNDLMKKLPDIFKIYFKREGVVHELRKLAKSSESTTPTALSPSSSSTNLASASAPNVSTPTSSSTTSPPAASTTPAPSSNSKRLADLVKKFHRSSVEPAAEQPKTESAPVTPKVIKTTQVNEELKANIARQAQLFCELHFPETDESSSSNEELINSFKKIQNLVEILKNKSGEKAAFLVALNDLALIMTEAGGGVSAFELSNSGLIPGLTQFLSDLGYDVPHKERLQLFVRVFLKGPELEIEKTLSNLKIDQNSQSFSYFLKRLHEAFSKSEQFPILIHEVVGADARGGMNGLRVLTQPFKLKLQKLETETEPGLKDYADNVVMIEPLASMQAIENFLFPKIADATLLNSAEKKKAPAETPQSEDSSTLFRRRQQSSRTRNDSEVHDISLVDNETSGEKSTESLLPTASSSSLLSPSTSSSQVAPATNQETNPKLDFFVGSVQLPANMTIFQAVEKYCRNVPQAEGSSGSQAPAPGRYLWSTVYTIKYRLHSTPNEDSTGAVKATTSASDRPKASFGLDSITENISFVGITNDQGLQEILRLMKILFTLNNFWSELFANPAAGAPPAPATEFVNNKLNAKLSRQLQDPLTLCSATLPDWCKEMMTNFPSLFLFETRYIYLYSSSFGIARGLMRLQERSQEQQLDTSNDTFKVGRIQRQKVRISRKKLLESAIRVMELYASSKAILEIEYFDEVGTGLGPTLEFYTSTSKEFRKKALSMWREGHSVETDDEFVHAPRGLYPKPMSKQEVAANSKIMYLFRMLGKFVAKALLDFRTVDLPFSPVFFKWMLGRESSLNKQDILDLDPQFAASLSELEKVCEEKKQILDDTTLTEEEKQTKISQIRLKGAEISHLSMDFVLPGYPNVPLKPNGENIPVTIDNIEEFVQLVTRFTLIDTVIEQMNAFRQGFSSVFPLEDLQPFFPSELDTLINGSEEIWDAEALAENIKADHGYSIDSVAIRRLLEIMSDFSPSQQRDFLRFVTGSPRLPIGGLKALTPKLTVVRKMPENGNASDDYLPSAMTCANYLKLPDYSSKEIMLQKLTLAMTEGQNSFYLS